MNVVEYTPETFDQIPDEVFDRPAGEIQIFIPIGDGRLYLEISSHEEIIMMWFDNGDDASLKQDIFRFDGETLEIFNDPSLGDEFVRSQVSGTIGRLLLRSAPRTLEVRNG